MASNINIRLFGGFGIYNGDEHILQSLSNTRKTKLFLCYLILNRDRAVSHKELFELLWSGEDYSNPGTALRTLLYRYRAMVDSSEYASLFNSIISRRSAYQWNPELDLKIDIFEFEDQAAKALGDLSSDDRRAVQLKQAIDLYTDNLLPDSNSEHWAVPHSVRLKELYVRVAMEYLQILKDREQYDEMVAVCKQVQKFVPYALEIENELMIATEKGGSSEAVKEEYHLFRSTVKDTGRVIKGVHDEMESDTLENSAFVCEYDMFRQVYKLQRRLLLRTGETMFLAMVTLKSKSEVHEPMKNERAMEALLECCKHELRMGDSICRYTDDLYAIMFPVDSYENAIKVMERVRKSFYKKSNLNEYMLVYRISPLKNAKE